jgi:phosphoribosyl 1,2-cyclic phosphate phosphodiesterase
VDAILFTHAHADHIMGLDDVRRYNKLAGGAIPCYAHGQTLQVLRRCFGYAVAPFTNPDRPSITLEPLDGQREICGVTVTPVPLHHGTVNIQGYRIGGMAYCTDCSGIPAESHSLLEGLDVLVIDALRRREHPAHFNLKQALAAVRQLAPRRALLTHIAHELGHAETSAELPPSVELAYDGMRLPVKTVRRS